MQKRKPTMKQKKAVQNYIENHGIASRAMLDAGYTPATAKNPSNLTKSPVWQELLNEYLPDNELTSKHKQLLEAKKVISANVFPDGKDGKPVNDFIEVEDNMVQAKALELAYRIKDKFPTEKRQLLGHNEIKITLTDEREAQAIATETTKQVITDTISKAL